MEMAFHCLLAGLLIGAYGATDNSAIRLRPRPTKAGSFASADALQAALWAAASYCTPDVVSSWTCPPCIAAGPAIGVEYLYTSSADTAGFVAVVGSSNEATGTGGISHGGGGRLVVVSFKGTNPEDIRNLVLDLEFGLSAIYPGCSSCAVHSGFYQAYSDMAEQMLQAVDTACGCAAGDDDDGQAPPLTCACTLLITGHSLGGALAQLAAYELTLAGYPVEALVTFGSPRVGNHAFAASFDAVVNQGNVSAGAVTLEGVYDAGQRAAPIPSGSGAPDGSVADAGSQSPLPPVAGVVRPSSVLVRAAQAADCERGERGGGRTIVCRHTPRLGHSRARAALQGRPWHTDGGDFSGGGQQTKTSGTRSNGLPIAAAIAEPGGRGWGQRNLVGSGTWRVVHDADLIPHLPMRILGYAHPPREVWYAATGNGTCEAAVRASAGAPSAVCAATGSGDYPGASSFRVCSSTAGEDPACSNSLWFPVSIADHREYLGLRISRMCGGDEPEEAQ